MHLFHCPNRDPKPSVSTYDGTLNVSDVNDVPPLRKLPNAEPPLLVTIVQRLSWGEGKVVP